MRKASQLLVLLIFLVVQLLATTFSPTTLSKLMNSSTNIIEGEVIDVYSYWADESKSKINTKIVVKVNNTIKGESLSTVEIIQPGGKIDNMADIVHGTFDFKKGDSGLFLLIKHKGNYYIHSLSMGFYKFKYDKNTQENVLVNEIIGKDLVKNDIQLEDLSAKNQVQMYRYSDIMNKLRVMYSK
ncbi:MAG: hypothetical protein Kow00108_17260 [Calditrichia bacterium]